MNLSISIKSKDTARVELFHPDTREKVGTLFIAGPDHEATKAWRRYIADQRQKKSYREDYDAEIKESLVRRIVGWEGVKDSETGEDVPFNKDLLPDLVDQFWLKNQVLEALGEESFFYKE